LAGLLQIARLFWREDLIRFFGDSSQLIQFICRFYSESEWPSAFITLRWQVHVFCMEFFSSSSISWSVRIARLFWRGLHRPTFFCRRLPSLQLQQSWILRFRVHASSVGILQYPKHFPAFICLLDDPSTYRPLDRVSLVPGPGPHMSRFELVQPDDSSPLLKRGLGFQSTLCSLFQCSLPICPL
jgi:hypothetical protein